MSKYTREEKIKFLEQRKKVRYLLEAGIIKEQRKRNMPKFIEYNAIIEKAISFLEALLSKWESADEFSPEEEYRIRYYCDEIECIIRLYNHYDPKERHIYDYFLDFGNLVNSLSVVYHRAFRSKAKNTVFICKPNMKETARLIKKSIVSLKTFNREGITIFLSPYLTDQVKMKNIAKQMRKYL